MNYSPALLIGLLFSTLSCNDKGKNEVFCRGEVIEETTRNLQNGQSTYRIYLSCAGKCENGAPCDSIVKVYDPPLPGGIIREVWYGCKGEQLPRGCAVTLQTIRDLSGTIIRRAKCTGRDNSCPLPGDSCLPRYKDVKDTIRSVATQKDSLYRQRWITTCECLNRSS